MPYFTFKINNEISFRTELTSIRTDITKKGLQCKRKCVIGSPYCATHLCYEHNLKIKTSQIPNSGKGLFAVDPTDSTHKETIFRKGETIVKYNGEVINLEELIERYGNKTAPYAIGLSKNRFEDGAKIRGCGALANTKPNFNNANISISRGRAVLKATKNIKNGDEIYVSYGRQYKLNEDGVEYATTKK